MGFININFNERENHQRRGCVRNHVVGRVLYYCTDRALGSFPARLTNNPPKFCTLLSRV